MYITYTCVSCDYKLEKKVFLCRSVYFSSIVDFCYHAMYSKDGEKVQTPKHEKK